MIVFDLRCVCGHVFEAWFGSSSAYENQRAGGMIACPICNATDVSKAVMAPNISAKANRRGDAPPTVAASVADNPEPPPEAIKAAIAALAKAQAKMLEKSEWVGVAFTERARAMHTGEEANAPIHGQATPDQARAMIEDGVPVAPLIVPVVPPKSRN